MEDPDDKFSARSYRSDEKSTLIALRRWKDAIISHSSASVIQVSVVNDTGCMEWTLTTGRRQLLANGSPVHLMLPRVSAGQSLVVSLRVLAHAPVRSAAEGEEKCYEVISEMSCKVMKSLRNAQQLAPYETFKDFRPRLRENAGLNGGARELLVLGAAESILPEKFSSQFTCSVHVENVDFVFYEGKNKSKICSRRLFTLPFRFLPSTGETEFSVKMDVSQDGSLTATVEQEDTDNRLEVCSPQIMDVVGRVLATDDSEPNLSVQLLRLSVAHRMKRVAVLRMDTTYQPNQVQRWRISLTPQQKQRRSTVGLTSRRSTRLFFVPRKEFGQTFRIESEALEDGTKYEIRVDGLQLFESGSAIEDSACKVVCSNSTELTVGTLEADEDSDEDEFERLFALERLSLSDRSHRLKSSLTRRGESAVRLNAKRLKIRIERETFHQATVVISSDNKAKIQWKITISKTSAYSSRQREYLVQATGTEQRYKIPLQFQPGNSYKVEVEGLGLTVPKQTANFRAELTMKDLRELHSRAKTHAYGYDSSKCVYLYRNKSQQYFDDIFRKTRGIMKVYDKDNSGDPGSPINLQIQGLFFMATVEPGTDGIPLRQSAFGSVRICIGAEELLRRAPNLYFVDYYCMRGRLHYVTLVMTKPGSKADLHCHSRLLAIDVDDNADNPFFFRDGSGDLRVTRGYHLLVELLFTEDLDINAYRHSLRDTPTIGRGSSTPGGIPKNPLCAQCNLDRNSPFEEF